MAFKLPFCKQCETSHLASRPHRVNRVRFPACPHCGRPHSADLSRLKGWLCRYKKGSKPDGPGRPLKNKSMNLSKIEPKQNPEPAILRPNEKKALSVAMATEPAPGSLPKPAKLPQHGPWRFFSIISAWLCGECAAESYGHPLPNDKDHLHTCSHSDGKVHLVDTETLHPTSIEIQPVPALTKGPRRRPNLPQVNLPLLLAPEPPPAWTDFLSREYMCCWQGCGKYPAGDNQAGWALGFVHGSVFCPHHKELARLDGRC